MSTCLGWDGAGASREDDVGGANEDVGCAGFLSDGWMGRWGLGAAALTSTTRPAVSTALWKSWVPPAWIKETRNEQPSKHWIENVYYGNTDLDDVWASGNEVTRWTLEASKLSFSEPLVSPVRVVLLSPSPPLHSFSSIAELHFFLQIGAVLLVHASMTPLCSL